ncbi:MAG TPA: alpha/beta hydrolase [Myxococcota bacterium]|nr:alpha/beta hydrolase [Myxococcota bacterium]
MPLESLRKRDVKPSLDPASPIPSSLNHMRATTFTLEASDGVSIVVHRWLPDKPLKGVVQIAHGWTEHAARYARVAEALCREAYAVYANDHRGHGRTARTPAELGFFAEDDGWNRCLDDLWRLNQRIRADYPRVPVVVFGHSLGSFMIQQFISEHGDAIAGAVLSGSNGKPLAVARLALLLARFERLRVGSHARSALLHGLVFGSFNRPFEPARTPFDWLSRDPIEVDKFLTDPLCGFRSTVRLYIDVLVALIDVAKPLRQARIPKKLPIYIFRGTRDPVGNNMGQLLQAYRAAGLEDVTYHFYQDGRHESLNEVNRDEVTRDLIAWVDGVVVKWELIQ